MAPSTPLKPKFSDGERVLCFHGPLLYDSKCLKFQIKEKIPKYLIHYSGWNKNWDEWVPESRVLKYNELNLQKQKELANVNRQDRKKKPAKGSSKKEPIDRESTVLPPQEKTPKQKNKEAAAPVTNNADALVAEQPKKKVRTLRAEQNVETEEEFYQKIEVKIKIMDELKHRLVDDWRNINYNKKLFSLPARISVDSLLQDYLSQKVRLKGMTENKKSASIEIVNGVTEYFNVMLGTQLLYEAERPQYNRLMSENPDTPPSQLYGPIYVLRLFTVIGPTLAYTQLSEETISAISSSISEIQKFIAKGTSTYFGNSDYIAASEEKSKQGIKRSYSVAGNDDIEDKKAKVKVEA